MINRITILFALFCALANEGYCQNNNRFQYLDDDLGVMTTSIHLMQDSYGYIWASTLSGITKYDGDSYRHYVKSDSIDGLPEVSASCTYEDKNNNIWVALYGYGIAILERDSDTFLWLKADTLDPNGLHLSKVKTITHDANDNIWFLGGDGIQRVKMNQNSYDNLVFESQEDFMPGFEEKITGLCLLNDTRGTFWIGANKGFYSIEKDQNVKKHETSDGLNQLKTHSILEDSSGDIIIVRGGAPLLKYDAESYTFETDDNVVFPDLNILSVIDNEDFLWSFIRPGKVYKYHLTKKILNELESYKLPYNIYGSYFYTPLMTREGTLWLAGAGSFPFQHKPKTYKEIHPVLYDNTKLQTSSCVYVDDEHIYIGQLLGGIKIIDKKTGVTKTLTVDNSPLVDNRIYKIYKVDKNRLFITGRAAVYVYDRNLQLISKVKRINSLNRCAYYAGGDIFWIGGEMKGIFKLDLRDMSIMSVFDGKDSLPEANTVTQIIGDDDGSIWIGGRYQGLFHYYPQSGNCDIYSQDAQDPKFKLSTSIIEAIHIDDEGDVWVGGRSGIDVIKTSSNTIQSIGISDGLKHVHVCDITQDDSLHYWVMSEKDISKINKKTRKISTYDSKDGFMNSIYYYRSFAKYDGNIFAAGELGVDKFNPNQIGINPVSPQLVLSDLRVMGEDYVSDVALENIDKITVDHNQNFIDLKVLALHYVVPEKNRIAYKFEGRHDDFIDNEKGTNISLSGLSSGIHKLWIKGSNSDDVWSEEKLITIDIAYPWWRTWTFYLVAFLFFGATAWFTLRNYLARIRNAQKEKEKVNAQIAELELKALSSQMNPHFLFNSLNSIKSLINQNKNAEASTFIIRYSRLIRQILNNSRSKFVRFQEEVDTIRLYLELEKLRLGDSFTYDIEMDADVQADFIEVPPALLQPYVENAIWHGLLNKEHDDKHLSIKICKKAEFLEIRIIDNGIGRKASKVIQSQSRLNNKSLGTIISKERINLISDLYGYDSAVNILDLTNEEGKPCGTEVQILLHIEH